MPLSKPLRLLLFEISLKYCVHSTHMSTVPTELSEFVSISSQYSPLIKRIIFNKRYMIYILLKDY